LLEGRDGHQKMSKSLGNAIGVCDEPAEMFGALMSISDELMMRYYELLSDCTLEHLAAIRSGNLHPMKAKKSLASEIVGRFHGPEAAVAATEAFERRFQRKELPPEVPEIEIQGESTSMTVVELLVGAELASSKSEAKRLIEQGGVTIDGKKIDKIFWV
jgi:tyrosyl-tRNA synthetase